MFLPIFLTGLLQVLKDCNKVTLEPYLFQAEKPQLPQPFLMEMMLQPSDQLQGPPLDKQVKINR